MNKSPVSKLCLGTAQFGFDYGIANKKGRIRREEAFEILDYARSAGIDTLDTAYMYGDAEGVLGEFIKGRDSIFRIISKFPEIDGFSYVRAEKLFSESLKRLGIKKIYGYMPHRVQDVFNYEGLLDFMDNLKRKNLVEKIGFSVYRPKDLDAILSSHIEFDMVQFPYSVFDRRFERYFTPLKKNNVKIYARSIFLQGAAFLDPHDLTENMAPARERIKILRDMSEKNKITVSSICINFVLSNPLIDKAVIGVDSLEHLKVNIESIFSGGMSKDIRYKTELLKIEDENILIPSNWGLK